MIRSAALFICAWLLTAAAPPPGLSPYVQNGVFQPGDYGWMRGKFPDARAEQKAEWRTIAQWFEACMASGQVRVREELIALGVKNPKVGPQPFGDNVCRAVADHNIRAEHWPSFVAFSQDLQRAQPVADAFLWATGLAVQHGGPRGPDLADRLTARPLGEQILRSALAWGQGATGSPPTLPAGQREIVLSRIAAALAATDQSNTEYLKEIVTKQGWPDRKVVGDFASHMAWLTAQHADADPAFQLRVLRLMEPMLATDGVHPVNYAYLYDRVMLKITGRQRYGTQTICQKGAYAPQPLEEPSKVESLRAAIGLEPLSTYLQQIAANAPKCPAG